MKTLLMIAVVGIAFGAVADTLRLPCRYVETSYVIHTMTGLTSNERTREKLKVVLVNVKRVALDGAEAILFEKPAPRNNAEDGASGIVPYADKAKFLEALAKARTTISRPSMSRDEKAETLYEGDSIQLRAFTGAKQYAELELRELGVSFVLSAVNVQQIVDAVKRL